MGLTQFGGAYLPRASIGVLAMVGLGLLQGCDEFPRDAKRTLEEVRGGERALRVGWTQAEPWVRAQPGLKGPEGLEVELVRRWAASIGARVEWVSGSEAQLVRALQRHALDLAVGGFSDNAPWGSRIGQTQPYLKAELAIGAAPGATVPESWDGVEVRHDRRRPDLAGAIRAIGAVPVPAEPGRLAPLGAAYVQEMEALGLRATGKRLTTERRVIATAPAENALVFSLDRFLLSREGEISTRLAEEARR